MAKTKVNKLNPNGAQRKIARSLTSTQTSKVINVVQAKQLSIMNRQATAGARLVETQVALQQQTLLERRTAFAAKQSDIAAAQRINRIMSTTRTIKGPAFITLKTKAAAAFRKAHHISL